MKQILNDTPQSCNQIEFDKYCKWKAVEEGATTLKTESKPIAVIQAVSFVAEEEVIDLIDSDDEAPPPPVPSARVVVTPLPSTAASHVVVSRETSEKESPPYEDTSSNSRGRDRHGDDDSEDEVVGPRRTTRASNRTKRTIREYPLVKHLILISVSLLQVKLIRTKKKDLQVTQVPHHRQSLNLIHTVPLLLLPFEGNSLQEKDPVPCQRLHLLLPERKEKANE